MILRRCASDFLKYCNDEGPYADFHANGHMFIFTSSSTLRSVNFGETKRDRSNIGNRGGFR